MEVVGSWRVCQRHKNVGGKNPRRAPWHYIKILSSRGRGGRRTNKSAHSSGNRASEFKSRLARSTTTHKHTFAMASAVIVPLHQQTSRSSIHSGTLEYLYAATCGARDGGTDDDTTRHVDPFLAIEITQGARVNRRPSISSGIRSCGDDSTAYGNRINTTRARGTNRQRSAQRAYDMHYDKTASMRRQLGQPAHRDG